MNVRRSGTVALLALVVTTLAWHARSQGTAAPAQEGAAKAKEKDESALPKVDESIAGYEKKSGISGNLNSVGSDTLNNCMTLWTQSFKNIYPNVNIQVEGKGS